jgi:hypothetical protein
VPVEVGVTNPVAAAASADQSQGTPKRPTAATPVVRPAPSPYTRQLVNNLVNLPQAGAPITLEQVTAWKQNLQQLVQQGPAALPAIREFLERNQDVVFGSESARALGSDSARAAMYDALTQIGGPEAASVLLDTLQNTASPRDIALLARSLEQLAPEQYRQQIVDAARQALATPTDGQSNPADMAPVFEALSKYGGAGAVADLGQTADRYKYYSAIALGQMPEGAGVPALIQMVQATDGGPVKNVPALEMLTQMAAQNPEARAALVQQTRANNIPPNLWPYLSAVLAGDQIQYRDSLSSSGVPVGGAPNDIRTYHIALGNQNFYTAPPAGGLTADQVNQQLALIDQLLAVAPTPTVQQTLQNARETLLSRSGQPASSGTAKP